MGISIVLDFEFSGDSLVSAQHRTSEQNGSVLAFVGDSLAALPRESCVGDFPFEWLDRLDMLVDVRVHDDSQCRSPHFFVSRKCR